MARTVIVVELPGKWIVVDRLEHHVAVGVDRRRDLGRIGVAGDAQRQEFQGINRWDDTAWHIAEIHVVKQVRPIERRVACGKYLRSVFIQRQGARQPRRNRGVHRRSIVHRRHGDIEGLRGNLSRTTGVTVVVDRSYEHVAHSVGRAQVVEVQIRNILETTVLVAVVAGRDKAQSGIDLIDRAGQHHG